MIPYATYPVLLDLGAVKIYSYGLITAIAILVGLYFAGREAQKKGIERNKIYDMSVWMLISGLVFARLFYIIQYGGNFFKVWEGGLVYWGGFVGAVVGLYLFTWKHKLPFLKVLDIIMLYVPLAHAIGRVGCYVKGCCYGLPMKTVMPWAVDYLGALRHPTQLYSIIGNLGIFGFLSYIKKYIKKDGFITAVYLISYPIMRTIVELFRADPEILGPLSAGQLTSIVMLILGIFLLFYVLKKEDKPALKRTIRRKSKN